VGKAILDRIIATKRDELRSLAPRLPELRARAAEARPPRGFAVALRDPDEVRLLAEVKRRSPSAGAIRPDADAADVARAYAAGGAAAVSVLTDRDYFGGDLEALQDVSTSVEIPVLRKDFIVDPAQVWEARASCADAVLLIVRILDPVALAELHALATELGMDVLVEVHREDELGRALEAGATLVGINNRDLDTFTTDLSFCLAQAPRVPSEVTLVGESGIRTAADVDRLGAAGIDAVLVGESLMRQDDLRAAAAALTGRPRRARAL
jgi:indole-3-glycerol phosphate synthase